MIPRENHIKPLTRFIHKLGLTFIILSFLIPTRCFSQTPTSFQSSLKNFYEESSNLIYEKYILDGYETLVWGRIINDTEYDLTLLYNDSIINRIKILNEKKENRTFEIVERDDQEIRRLKESFKGINRKDGKHVIAEIKVEEIRITGNTFSLKWNLQLTTRENIDRPFVLTREFRDSDPAISNYIIKKHYSPFITFAFIGFTLFIILALINVSKLKQHGIIKEVNVSFFYMGTFIFFIAIMVFVGLTYLKHNLIGSTAFFKGAEVHFFVDTNAGLYFEPETKDELNFTQISALLSKKIFNNISSSLYMGRSMSEKLSDSIFAFISYIMGAIGSEDFHIREFVELKKSDYFYKFHTFSFDEYKGQDKLRPLAEGRFGEIEDDFDANLAHISQIHRDNEGQSSLIKPLMQLIKLLDEKEAAKKGEMKRFIIILTDADEGLEGNIRELLKHIGVFYKKKDRYLRVFSILFPNIPKSEDKIYYFETGKLVLLSKISEMIVNLNANKYFNIEKFKKENQLYYRNLNLTKDKNLEEQYHNKLNEMEIFIKDGKVPGIEELASQGMLMDYIGDKERQYIKMIKKAKGDTEATDKVDFQDFFIYTYVNNMYCMEHAGNSMLSECRQDHDCKCDGLEFAQRKLWEENKDIKIDYNTTRTKYFSLKKNKDIMRDLSLISNVFVNHFIFINFDKEKLISAINNWLPFLTILLGLIFAWFLYRYRYHVNYKFGLQKMMVDTVVIMLILLSQIFLYLYIYLNENNWLIYGNFSLALIVSMGFAICVYIIPQAINLVLLKKVSVEKDVLFSFEQPRWLLNIDRYLFDFILLPFMTISTFLIIWFPVLKEAPTEADGGVTLLISRLLLDYNNIIDTFFIVWGVIGLLYILRSFIYSSKLEKQYKFG